MTVADTDVLIDFFAGSGPAHDAVETALEDQTLATTVVSRFELLSGARTDRALKTVHWLLDAMPTLPLHEAAADKAAELRRLEAAGNSIGMADSLIAGIVLASGGVLLTRNRRHFQRVEDLRLFPLDI